jgi:hypothetical protein
MKAKVMRIVTGLLVLAFVCTVGISAENDGKPQPKKAGGKFFVHDMAEPRPVIIRPGKTDDQPPSDAIVLFDGKDTSQWSADNGAATKWIVNKDGALECTNKAGYIRSKKEFGSCQLHIEWASPERVEGTGQGRGNSGVFLMGIYEIQVLDSWQDSTKEYDNITYADGQTASVYGQKKPLVNASRSHGEWQSYDIIFHRPVFEGGKCVKPGIVTVIHNGVLVQDNWPIKGTTWHNRTAAYEPHDLDDNKGPLRLQDHGNPVRYRNIWVREIPEIITE